MTTKTKEAPKTTETVSEAPKATQTQLNTQAPTALNGLTLEGARGMWGIATQLAAATIIPQDFQNNPANVFIAMNMATRMGADVFQVMQNIYIVYGRPAWSAKFLIAVFNQCGRFSSIKYEFSGTEGKDNYGCRAYATELATGEVLRGPLITVDLAKKEGWYSKTSKDGKIISKWPTMTEQMLRYRSAAWFINTVVPELAMGMSTKDEVEDFAEAEIIEPLPRAAAKPKTQLVEWEISELEDFDELLEQAHVLFVDAGSAGYFESFAKPWREKRGRGDANEVIPALVEAVVKLRSVESEEAEFEEAPQEAPPKAAPPPKAPPTAKSAGTAKGAAQPLMDTHGA